MLRCVSSALRGSLLYCKWNKTGGQDFINCWAWERTSSTTAKIAKSVASASDCSFWNVCERPFGRCAAKSSDGLMIVKTIARMLGFIQVFIN